MKATQGGSGPFPVALTAAPNWATQIPLGRDSTSPLSKGYPSLSSPGNPFSFITRTHKNLGQSLSSSENALIEESALTWLAMKNHNHNSYPTPRRHCGSGKEHGKECDSNHWGWNAIYYQIITCYLQAGITHKFLPQGESALCISQSPLPVFSIIVCNGDCAGSEGKSAMCVYLCECVRQ